MQVNCMAMPNNKDCLTGWQNTQNPTQILTKITQILSAWNLEEINT